MSAWPGMRPSRFRGQILTGASRSGRGFYYGGRRVLLMDVPGTEVVWAGEGIAQFSEDVLDAVFDTLSRRGLDYMRARTPVDTGALVASEYAVVDANNGRYEIQVGAEAAYALYVELGTSRMAAQPFMRPTLDYLASIVMGTLQSESRARGA